MQFRPEVALTRLGLAELLTSRFLQSARRRRITSPSQSKSSRL